MLSKHIPFAIYDDNPISIEAAAQLGYEILTDYSLNSITDLVLAPGIDQNKNKIVDIARQKNLRIWNDISLFFSMYPEGHRVGFTGSFGKSTAVTLFEYIYNMQTTKQFGNQNIQLGGNIGIPIFDCDPKSPIILELSAQQLELCHNLPLDVAVLMNLYPQHIDRYGSMEKYLGAKKNILNNSRIKVVDRSIISLIPDLQYECQTTSTSNPEADYYLEDDVIHEKGTVVGKCETNIAGTSLIAAYAALRSINVDPEDILKSLPSFSTLKHRCEVVFCSTGTPLERPTRIIVNDSKSTNLLNSIYCIQKFSKYGSISWICGGYQTPQDMNVLRPILHKLDYVATTATSGKNLYSFFESNMIKSSYHTNLNDCLEGCIKSQTDLILFSPGYPSMDQYKNFEERGEHFTKLIRKIFGHEEVKT